jgi:hypothetical protein
VALLVIVELEEVKNTEGEAEALEALHTKEIGVEAASLRIKVNNLKTQHL